MTSEATARLAVTLTVEEFRAEMRAAFLDALESQRAARSEPPKPPTMAVSEAAEALNVSPKTVDRWCKAGRLKSVKSGGRRLILRASVDLLLEGAV